MSNGLSFRDSWNVWRRKVNEALGNTEPIPASNISYDNTSTGLSATNVQGAIDKVNDKASSKMQYISISKTTNVFDLMNNASSSRIHVGYSTAVTDGTDTFKDLLNISQYARVELFNYNKYLAVIRIVDVSGTFFIGYAGAELTELNLMKITTTGNSIVTIRNTV